MKSPRPTLHSLISCCALALVLSPACSDDDHPGNNNAPPDAGADASTGESLTFVITTLPSADGTFVPLEGATVAFDAPGGERTEVVTGADGRATFEGLDWSAGAAILTVHHPGYIIISALGITPTTLAEMWATWQGAHLMVMSPLDATFETVTVEGTVTGLQDATHLLIVNAVHNVNARSQYGGTGADTWRIEVPRNEPFVFQAVEYEYTELPSGQGYECPIYQRMHMDYGPLSADATGIVLGFDTHRMTSHTADVSMLMPPRTDSPLRTGRIPYCYFCASNSSYCQGWPTYLDVVDNHSRIDISFEWAEPAWVENPFWFCSVSTSTGEYGMARAYETPGDGAQPSLMDSPAWVTPADPSTAHPLHAPLVWTWQEDVEVTNLSITRAGKAYWIVVVGPNATTATVPEPPSSVNLSQLLGAIPRIGVYGGTLTPDGLDWARLAQGRSALLEL